MSQELRNKYKEEDFSLLIEAGFVATKQLNETDARACFEAAQVLSPNHTAPKIGLGYIALNKMEIKEACRIFEEVCKEEPDNYLAQTFLGMSYMLTKDKRTKGEKLVKEAKEKTDDPTVIELGETSLDWCEKDLKKSKAPFFEKKEEK